MAASVSFSRVRALPTWSSSVSGSGDDHQPYSVLAMSARPRRSSARPLRSPARMMGNVNAGKGLFAPLVVVARNIIGRKRFNQLRGKAIALHSQTRAWELMHGARDDLYEGPKGKEIGDEEESRSNRPSTLYTLGVDLGILKLSRGGLGASRVIPTPGTALGPSSRKTGPLALSFCPVGLQVALDIAIG